jgi:hypothetical protein
MTKRDIEQGRLNLLSKRQAVLISGGPGSQEQASRLWSEVIALESELRRRS